MNKNKEQNLLLEINEKSIFYKIKRFFKKMLKNKNIIVEEQIANNIREEKLESTTKSIESEQNLLKLQSKYRKGEIKEEQLTLEQINSLCKLYDKQIFELKKSNEYRKQKLLKYKY